MKLSNKKVFITGGGSGIGKALIEEFSKQGVRDIAVFGRNITKINKLEDEFPEISFLKIQGDISQINDIDKAVSILNEEWDKLDILVNNAGVVSAGYLESISDDDIINQISINLTGLILMTKHMIPLIKKSQDAAIINISSGLGYIAMPFYSVYAATKAGVRHFSEALRRELYEDPIHIMTIYPTATDTPMMESAKVEEMDSPAKVARESINGLINNDFEVILGGSNRKQMVNLNFEAPSKVDEKIKQQFEAIRMRASKHRAM